MFSLLETHSRKVKFERFAIYRRISKRDLLKKKKSAYIISYRSFDAVSINVNISSSAENIFLNLQFINA